MSAFVCLPLGQIFGAFFIDLGFRGAPWGHIKGTWTLKMTTLVPHLAGVGSKDRCLMNLECILGAILDTILDTGGHFWQWLLHFGTLLFSDVFGMVSGTCPGRANVAKTLQILYQNEISHVGKRVDFGSVLDHIWYTFGTLLAPIVVKWVPLQRA